MPFKRKTETKYLPLETYFHTFASHTPTYRFMCSHLFNETPKPKWPTWFMWGWSHADFPPVSQQHGTSHRIEQYHIILIREMCWKAISSSNKWPTAQQKPEESHLCRQRLCHEKSLILNPLTCHPHSKGPLGKKGAFSGWGQESGTERKGLQGGSMRDTRREGGTGVTPAPLSQKRGLWGEGWGSHPCSWLVPCEAPCFLSLPSVGLCFTCKQWQWPQLAWPSAASKLAGPRKEGEGG